MDEEARRRLALVSKILDERKYLIVDGDVLGSPVGTISDFYPPSYKIDRYDNLNESELQQFVLRDTLPIPPPHNREWYGKDHFKYWLFGLSDYLRVVTAAS